MANHPFTPRGNPNESKPRRGPVTNSRRQKTFAEDVIIPAHLLNSATVQDYTGEGSSTTWSPGVNAVEYPGRDQINGEVNYLRTHGTVRLSRHNTVELGGVARSRDTGYDSRANSFLVADDGLRKPVRKTSVPTERERRRNTYFTNPSEMAISPREDRGAEITFMHELSRLDNGRRFSWDENSEDDALTLARNTPTHSIYASSHYGSDDGNPFADPPMEKVKEREQKRRSRTSAIVDAVVPNILQRSATKVARRSSMMATYENAKKRGVELQRARWVEITFEYVFYFFLLCFVYFVLIGMPLWKGAVFWLWWVVGNKFAFTGGFSITIGIAAFYAFAPLLVLFEKSPAESESEKNINQSERIKDTALMIPCYKSAGLIAATLEAALQIFPPQNIFVIANGNSPTPLDNTEEICQPYGVNHIWSPIGSKIVAQFVGCYAARDFKNVLLIDDDCKLPEDFPVVTERLKGNVMCIGYTIKSTGPNSSKGNLCQQAQDLEYKLSGLQRVFAGKIGSATFPHGAISLWDRQLLIKTFHEHPGFNVSEDWFFGHVARQLGSRIQMCSSTFVETETPSAVFFSSGGARGGFGEMTIFQQRFKRWNFFFVNGMYYNMAYIFCDWKLGWAEIGAKIFVFQEVYETLLYLLTPFVLPISFLIRPSFCGILLGATVVMYLINTVLFNEIHLRLKKERIGWVCLYVYYLPYKIVLTAVNVASCYWSLYKYARYFAKRHPKVTEDEKAVEVVVRLEESHEAKKGLGRQLTVTAIGARLSLQESRDPVSAALHALEGARSNEQTEQLAAAGTGARDFATQPAATANVASNSSAKAAARNHKNLTVDLGGSEVFGSWNPRRSPGSGSTPGTPNHGQGSPMLSPLPRVRLSRERSSEWLV